MHVDTSVEATIPGPSGRWSLRYHRAADELCLYDGTGLLLAGKSDGAAEIGRLQAALTQGSGPIGLRLPSADLDLDWTLLLLPGSGDLVVHNPLGHAVGGSHDAAGLVGLLAAAL